ncbi:MAG: nucleolar RNA-binding Nop10p family protein [Nanoarchaeota archaeon]
MKHILKCSSCNNYTMKEICYCGNSAFPAKPLKYSQEDKFGSYRRRAKINEYISRGLL